MSSERQILKRLLEGIEDTENPTSKEELEEASFEANGSHYSCAFGKYSKDGEPISREDYFKAKDGGNVGGNVGSKSKSKPSDKSKKIKPDKSSGSVSISKNVFNADAYSNEAYDLADDIQKHVADVRDKFFDDVDIDDVGLNAYGDTSGDREIVFGANTVGHFYVDPKKGPSYRPLKPKEVRDFTSELEKSIKLPKDDDKYEYSLKVKYDDLSLRVSLKRDKK